MATVLKAPTSVGASDVTLVTSDTDRTKVSVIAHNHSDAYVYLEIFQSADTPSADGEQCGGADVPPRGQKAMLEPVLPSTKNLLGKAEGASAIVCTVYEEGS